MPWPSEHKRHSRERILCSAIELFSQKGFDKVSIGEVMNNAQLTHGAFYAHFDSKQALYAEAIGAAARQSALARMLPEDLADAPDLKRLLAGYLSIAHVAQEEPPCPLAFLATDVANREGEVRSAYTRVFRRLLALIGRQLPGNSGARKDKALALAAMMVGGVAVARALDDEPTSHALLRACREIGEQLIEDSP